MPFMHLLAALFVVDCVLVQGVFLFQKAGKSSALPNQNVSNASSVLGNFPTGQKFVIVLRGQSFRYRNDTMNKTRLACQDYAIDSQLSCSLSLVEKVIKPLEEHGNQVKVLITDSIENPVHNLDTPMTSFEEERRNSTFQGEFSRAFAQDFNNVSLMPPGACHLTPLIENVFNANSSSGRVVGTKYMESTGQPWNIKNAVEFLKATYGGVEGVQQEFDFVMVIRHDLRWVKDALEWDASFDKFNFFSRCETPAALAVGGDDCVWDTVHLMPSSMFGIFDKTLGADKCFEEYDQDDHNRFVGHGHGCFEPMRNALKSASADVDIGFLTNQRHRVRGETGVVDLVLPKWPDHRKHPSDANTSADPNHWVRAYDDPDHEADLLS